MIDMTDEMREAVGTRLLAVRQRAGITQSLMASSLQVSAQAYKNYEHGKRELPLTVAARVSVEFGVSLDWLVFNHWPELKASSLELLKEASAASFDMIGTKSDELVPDKFGKLVSYVYAQSLLTGMTPRKIVGSVQSIIR